MPSPRTTSYRAQESVGRHSQGVSYKREVTTLGRGGSDTTAVAMAAALDAEYCEICSDVDGVYSADPRVVPAAVRIATLSYEETQEMAEAGAKVLNAQAVEFAKERGIAIYARATQGPLPGPDPSSDGTVVRKSPPRMPGTVVGVASERDVVILESTAEAARVLSMLDERGVPGKQLHIFDDRTSVVISRENLHDAEGVERAMYARFADRVRFINGLGAVSAIGAGINATYANVRAGLSVLRQAEIPCNGIQALQIPMPKTRSFRNTSGGSTIMLSRYYLEFRTKRGLDDKSAVPGPRVFVHVGPDMPAANRSSTFNWVLDMDPSTSNFDGMNVNQTYNDPAGGVSFTVTAMDNDRATVSVTIANGTGSPTCMDGTTLTAPGPAESERPGTP